MCPPHWRMVPKDLQQAVWANYRPGQCDDKDVTRAWLDAADAAIEAVWKKEQEAMARKKTGGAAVQHSSASNEHYGPPWVLEKVHQLMGDIDLDPASCAAANQIVKAERYYSLERGENGLVLPWRGRVYLNPPGGAIDWPSVDLPKNRRHDHNQAALWWAYLVSAWAVREIEQACFMVFNLETIRYAQGYPVPHILDFPTWWPDDRVDFWAPGPDGVPAEQGSPAHPNCLVYLPPVRSDGGWLPVDPGPQRFEQLFQEAVFSGGVVKTMGRFF